MLIRMNVAIVFLAAALATSVPIQQEHGVLYVRATVNGEGPLLFTLDPGAQDVYTSYARERLRGRVPQTVCLSDACFPDAMAYLDGDPAVIDPRHDPSQGIIAGSIGPALLRQYVTRIDYRHSTLTLIQAAAFRASPAARRLLMHIDSNGVPAISAAVDGLRGTFELDVRAPTSMLFAPFLDRTGLRRAYAGAPVARRSATLIAHPVRSVQVSGVTFTGIPFWFSTSTSGKFASRDVAGLLGNNVLSHFEVTLDLPHQSAYLTPYNS